jgi:hypothetical protein
VNQTQGFEGFLIGKWFSRTSNTDYEFGLRCAVLIISNTIAFNQSVHEVDSL